MFERGSVKLILLSFLAGLILLGTLFFYVDFAKLLQGAKVLNPWKIAFYLGIGGLPIMLATWRWQVISAGLGNPLPFWRLLAIRLAGFAGSFLTPVAEAGGGPIKVLLLRNYFKMPWDKNLAGVFVDGLVEFLIQVLLTGLGVALLLFYIKPPLGWLMLGVLIIFIIWLAGLLNRIVRGEKVLDKLVRFFKLDRLGLYARSKVHLESAEALVLELFKKRKKVFFKAAGISVLVFLASFLEMGILLYFLALAFNLSELYLIKTIMNLSYAFPVPAALGVAEWGQAGFFEAASFGKSSGALFSLLFKGKDLFYALIGVGVIFYSGLKVFLLWVNKK
jgi:uncharacterized protein (TIRG00374 family)